jgi:hypothetical protein
MKNAIYLLMSIFMTALLSCDSPVIFTVPQPKGFSPQSSFSIFYRGSYFCESDSSLVYITDEVVFKQKDYHLVMPKTRLDTMSDVRLVDGKLQIKGMDEWVPATIIRDSVHAQIAKRDTLFAIGQDQVLTMFRGHHILNNKRSDNYWEVAILTIDEEMNIILSMAAEPEDLERLKEVTPVTDLSRGDTVQYLINPTVHEFNQILDEELIFKDLEYYYRVAALMEM